MGWCFIKQRDSLTCVTFMSVAQATQCRMARRLKVLKLCRRKRLCPNMRYYTSVSLDGLGRTTKNRKRVGVIIKIISGNLVDRIVKIYQLGPSC